MFNLLGTALELSTSLVKMASATQLHDYSGWKSSEWGLKAEEAVFRILSHLDAEVYLAPNGSALDCQLKGDIVLQVGETSFIYQVKSNLETAQHHLNKKSLLVLYDGSKQAYPACGCIISTGSKLLEDAISPLELVLLVSGQTGIPLKPAVQEAVDMATKLKGKTLPGKLFTKQYTALLELGLAKPVKGDLVFN
jgi:hypothetical protein